MNISEIMSTLNNISNHKLRSNENLPQELVDKLNKGALSLQDEKEKYLFLKKIYAGKNRENLGAYDYYYIILLKKLLLDKDTIFLFLEDRNIYSIDILRYLWDLLSVEEKKEYYNKITKFDNILTDLFNEDIKDNFEFVNLLKDDNFVNKLKDNSILIPSKLYNTKYLNLSEVKSSLLKKINSDSLTSLVNFRYKSPKRLSNLLNKNINLVKFISNQGLEFRIGKEDLLKLLLQFPYLITKLDSIHIIRDLSMEDIQTIESKLKILEKSKLVENALLYIKQLYIILKNENNRDLNYYITKSADYSIIFYPFKKIDFEDYRNLLVKYVNLKKFAPSVMEQIVVEYFNEDEKVSLFRDSQFIADMSGEVLTSILDTMNFRTVFNLLQNKELFLKIKNLNCNIEEFEFSLMSGYLDDPLFVEVSSSDLVFNAINSLKTNSIRKYLRYPYIKNKLTFNQFLTLASKANVKILDLFNVFNINDFNWSSEYKTVNEWLKIYVDKCLQKEASFKIFGDKETLMLLYDLPSNVISQINMSEIEYLLETILMKNKLKNTHDNITYEGVRSLLASYIALGFDKTVKLINDGTNNLELEDIIDFKTKLKKSKLTIFKVNNQNIFEQLNVKLKNNLLPIALMYKNGISNFSLSELIYDFPFLKNIIRMMNESGYSNYQESLETIERYINYYFNNSKQANIILYNFTNGFIEYLLTKKSEELDQGLQKNIINILSLTSEALHRQLQGTKDKFLQRKHFMILTNILDGIDDKKISSLVKNHNDFITKLNKELAEELTSLGVIDNSIINGLEKNLFYKFYKNKLNIFDFLLNYFNIAKPIGYDEYRKSNNEELVIKKLNHYIIQNTDNIEDRINCFQYVLYDIPLNKKYKSSIINKLNEYRRIVKKFMGEIFINKVDMLLEYKRKDILGDKEEIISYDEKINIIKKIIKKTIIFLNENINDNKLLKAYRKEYESQKKEDKLGIALNKKNFIVNRMSFGIQNLINIFKGYDFRNEQKLTDEDFQFLFERKNIYFAGVGLCDFYNIPFGQILNNLNSIKSMYMEAGINIQSLDLDNAAKLARYLLIDENINRNILINNEEAYAYQRSNIYTNIPPVAGFYNSIYYEITDKMTANIDEDNVSWIMDDNKCLVKLIDPVTNEVLAQVYGERIGNSLVFNAIGIDEDLLECLDKVGEKIIKKTQLENESIDFVIIRTDGKINGVSLDSKNCSCYQEIISLFNKDDLDNYNYYITAAVKEVKAENFINYEVTNKYLRKRNKNVYVSNIAEMKLVDKARSILYKYAEENDKNVSSIDDLLANYKEMYLGDDWVLIIDKNNVVNYYITGIDDRAQEEVNDLLKKIEKEMVIDARSNYRLHI